MSVGLPQLLYSNIAGSSDTNTSTAISPTPGRLLVAIASGRRGAATASDPFTITGGITWGVVTEERAQNDIGGPSMRQAIWAGIVPSGLSPFSVVVRSINSSHTGLILFEVDEAAFTSGRAVSNGNNLGDPAVVASPGYNELVIYAASFAANPTLTVTPGTNSLVAVTGTNSYMLVTYSSSASNVGSASWNSNGTRAVGAMMEIKSSLAAAALAVDMTLEPVFTPSINVGRGLAVSLSLGFAFTAVNTSAASPENPSGVWRAATRTWSMPGGVEPVAGNNLTFS
mgnify:FL=1